MTDEPQKAPTQQPQPQQQGQQHHGRPPRRRYHEQRGRPPQQNPVRQETTGNEKPVGLDDEDTEQDRAVQPSRGGRRGGRPVKKVYEEWASDPYCE